MAIRNKIFYCCAWGAVVMSGIAGANALAQESSLLRRELPTNNRLPIYLKDIGPLYIEPVPRKEIQLHDIISIRVDEKARMVAEGEVERRKTASYNAALLDWLRLVGLSTVKPAPQSDGDPRVRGELTQLYRAEGEQETRELLTFNIAATVVDIRGNGTLVLEARRRVRNNNEVWEYSLTGICSKDVVGPGNIVLSRDIAQLSIDKRERGHVRDSYRRGWVMRLMDMFNPF